MGIVDSIKQSVEQLKAARVARGETPASEMYKSQEIEQREEARKQEAAERKRREETEREDKERKQHESAQEHKRERHGLFQRDRAKYRESESERKEKEEKTAAQKKFEREQADYNVQMKLRVKDEEYRKEQEEVQKKNRTPTFGEKAGEMFAKAIKPATDVRQRNIMRMEKQPTERPLTRSEVNRMITKKQAGTPQKGGAKMSSGQFHAPMFGGGPKGGSNMMNLDPFAGIGGTAFGKKKKKGGGGRGGFMDPFNF